LNLCTVIPIVLGTLLAHSTAEIVTGFLQTHSWPKHTSKYKKNSAEDQVMRTQLRLRLYLHVHGESAMVYEHNKR
jgi:hypothetical protein